MLAYKQSQRLAIVIANIYVFGLCLLIATLIMTVLVDAQSPPQQITISAELQLENQYRIYLTVRATADNIQPASKISWQYEILPKGTACNPTEITAARLYLPLSQNYMEGEAVNILNEDYNDSLICFELVTSDDEAIYEGLLIKGVDSINSAGFVQSNLPDGVYGPGDSIGFYFKIPGEVDGLISDIKLDDSYLQLNIPGAKAHFSDFIEREALGGCPAVVGSSCNILGDTYVYFDYLVAPSHTVDMLTVEGLVVTPGDYIRDNEGSSINLQEVDVPKTFDFQIMPELPARITVEQRDDYLKIDVVDAEGQTTEIDTLQYVRIADPLEVCDQTTDFSAGNDYVSGEILDLNELEKPDWSIEHGFRIFLCLRAKIGEEEFYRKSGPILPASNFREVEVSEVSYSDGMALVSAKYVSEDAGPSYESRWSYSLIGADEDCDSFTDATFEAYSKASKLRLGAEEGADKKVCFRAELLLTLGPGSEYAVSTIIKGEFEKQDTSPKSDQNDDPNGDTSSPIKWILPICGLLLIAIGIYLAIYLRKKKSKTNS